MDYWSICVLALGMVTVVGMIQFLKVNAFIALVTSALVVSLAAPPARISWSAKVTLVAESFGNAAGKIGIVIAMAAVIGKCLMESGAADRLVRGLLSLFGPRRAWLALLLSGYLLSIPVFFDTVFYLLVPLAITLCLRLGQDYVWSILAIAAGAAITHVLVPPTPGPLIMADVFDENGIAMDMGLLILVGMATAVIPALAGGWGVARWMNRRVVIPLRPTAGISLDALRDLARRPTAELPSLGLSVLPVLLPILLIGTNSVLEFTTRVARGQPAASARVDRAPTAALPRPVAAGMTTGLPSDGAARGAALARLRGVARLVGDPNLALMFSAFIAMATLKRYRRLTLLELGRALEPALAAGALIILITAAGGAFGKALAESGVGDSIAAAAKQAQVRGLAWLPLAFAVASVLKIAQGSSTVAMITAAGMVAPILTSLETPLGYHPVYMLMAIGCGSIVGCWMNDSGFWVVCRMSGFTEGETLRTFTVTLIVMGLSGLVVVMVAAWLVPLTGLLPRGGPGLAKEARENPSPVPDAIASPLDVVPIVRVTAAHGAPMAGRLAPAGDAVDARVDHGLAGPTLGHHFDRRATAAQQLADALKPPLPPMVTLDAHLGLGLRVLTCLAIECGMLGPVGALRPFGVCAHGPDHRPFGDRPRRQIEHDCQVTCAKLVVLARNERERTDDVTVGWPVPISQIDHGQACATVHLRKRGVGKQSYRLAATDDFGVAGQSEQDIVVQLGADGIIGQQGLFELILQRPVACFGKPDEEHFAGGVGLPPRVAILVVPAEYARLGHRIGRHRGRQTSRTDPQHATNPDPGS
ncbi:MAG: hypothetical protein A2W31_07305 [Planctomycetes bacterium RBG_16_64_10]|nr:MAG: hypothetical protein A2W31_07305 [Planctomycetes bacterium RBG_16_64_10]